MTALEAAHPRQCFGVLWSYEFRSPFLAGAIHSRADRLCLSNVASGGRYVGYRLRVPFWSSISFTHLLPRNEAALVLASAVPAELPSITNAALVGVFSIIALRAFIYFRIQYIIAAMLGRYIPRGGCRVLDLSIHEGRNLYYYPNDVAEVVAIADRRNSEVVKNQAIRAGVPINIKLKALKALGLPSNTMDAVVSVYSLGGLKEEEAKSVVREALRVLKPGKPFVFVENIVSRWQIVRVSQELLQKSLRLVGIESSSLKDTLKLLEDTEGVEKLDYEVIFEFQDPHIVGVAMKHAELAENVAKKKRNRRSFSP